MKRVAVVVTARPSYSRIRSALLSLRGMVDLRVIAAASALTWRHGRVVDVMRSDGIEVAAEVPAVVDGGGRREAVVETGLLAVQLGPILETMRPDCAVTIADRHETLATAIAASYQHIPLAHVQGGEVTGSIDDKVRNAVTQLADFHLTATERAATRVRTMRPGAAVLCTGCPSLDLAEEARKLGPIKRAEVVVLQHPVTGEVDWSGEQMGETLRGVEGWETLFFWPGEEPGADAMSKALRLAGKHPVRNLAPVEFLRVLLGVKVLVGNSSAGIRECSYLGVPVVNVGSRQQGRERGPNVLDVGYSSAEIAQAVESQAGSRYPSSHLYGDGESGPRAARALRDWVA